MSVQLGSWKPILCQGLETQMLTSEGHALREEGLVGPLPAERESPQLREQLPQSPGQLWPFGQFVIFQGKSEIYNFGKFFCFCFVCFLRVVN